MSDLKMLEVVNNFVRMQAVGNYTLVYKSIFRITYFSGITEKNILQFVHGGLSELMSTLL